VNSKKKYYSDFYKFIPPIIFFLWILYIVAKYTFNEYHSFWISIYFSSLFVFALISFIYELLESANYIVVSDIKLIKKYFLLLKKDDEIYFDEVTTFSTNLMIFLPKKWRYRVTHFSESRERQFATFKFSDDTEYILSLDGYSSVEEILELVKNGIALNKVKSNLEEPI
jgi:hypothetical protein